MRDRLLKILFTLCCLFLVVLSVHSQTLWYEDFEGESDGATSGTASGSPGGTWSISYGGGGTFSKQDVAFVGNSFQATSLSSVEGVWMTNVIDISSYGYAIIDLSSYTAVTESGDYLRAYYILDNNGVEVPFYSMSTSFVNATSGGSAIVSGSQLQIVVRMFNNNNFDTWGIDDVLIQGVSTLYSITGGSWNSGSTWSTTSHSGTSCGCIPNNLTRALIGAGHAVDINAESDAILLEVESGGSLGWGTTPADLNVGRGGINVHAGASISSGSSSTAQIDFDGSYDAPIIVDGSLVVGDMEFNGSFDAAVSGIGTFTIWDDMIFNGDVDVTSSMASMTILFGDIDVNSGSNSGIYGTSNWTVGNDLTFTGGGFFGQNTFTIATSGSFAITNQIYVDGSYGTIENQSTLTVGSILFDNDNCDISNSGTFSVSGDIRVNNGTDDGNTFVNNSGGILSFDNLIAGGGDFSILNSGTINQTGRFLGIPSNTNAANDINNLDGGIWNYSGILPDADLRLFANNGTNTFNYDRAGSQDVIAPVAGNGYSNIKFSGSGTKTALGNFSVSGDWTRSGSASFANAGYTVTFNGGSKQHLNSWSGSESFTNCVINKSGILQLLAGTDLSVSGTLTLTNGGIDLGSGDLIVTNSSAGAISRTNGYIVSENSSTPYSNVIWSIGTSTGSHVIPFGISSGSSNYIPFTFNVTSAGVGSGTVSVATYATGTDNTPFPSGVTSLNNAGGTNNSANVVDRFWIITPTGYTTNPTATLTFTATSGEVGSITNLVAQRWSGAWDDPLPGQSSGSTSVTVPGVNQFSPWTISGNNSVLPIELTSFTGKVNGSEVLLKWETASELNNDFFTVERSSDLEIFEPIGTVKGNSTTSKAHSYSLIDTYPIHGQSYYRLKQTDFDGTFTYSNVVYIDYEGSAFPQMRLYPNPTSQNYVTIKIEGLSNDLNAMPVQVVDALGRVCHSEILPVSNGRIEQAISMKNFHGSGVYLVSAGSNGILRQRLVVQ